MDASVTNAYYKKDNKIKWKMEAEKQNSVLSGDTVLPDAGEEMGRKGFLKMEGELL